MLRTPTMKVLVIAGRRYFAAREREMRCAFSFFLAHPASRGPRPRYSFFLLAGALGFWEPQPSKLATAWTSSGIENKQS